MEVLGQELAATSAGNSAGGPRRNCVRAHAGAGLLILQAQLSRPSQP